MKFLSKESNYHSQHSNNIYNYCMRLTDVEGNVQFVNFEYFPSEKEIKSYLGNYSIAKIFRLI